MEASSYEEASCDKESEGGYYRNPSNSFEPRFVCSYHSHGLDKSRRRSVLVKDKE